MSDELKPALSAEEWARIAIPTPITAPGRSVRVEVVDAGLLIGPREFIGRDDVPALIALANAALPDDSPYKITRDDVTILDQLVCVIPNGVGLGDDPNGARRWLRGFVTKLAALLPPLSGDC